MAAWCSLAHDFRERPEFLEEVEVRGEDMIDLG
jgi:hypothetical protein